jgi:glycosyltransferase involved in cell wall biosynthesis
LQALKKVVYNTEAKQQLIEKGYRQMKNFSWQKTADQTMEVYRQVLHPYS